MTYSYAFWSGGVLGVFVLVLVKISVIDGSWVLYNVTLG